MGLEESRQPDRSPSARTGSGEALDRIESRERKTELDRIAAMLSRLGGRGYRVKEDPVTCRYEEIDFDSDSDFDLDKRKSQQADALDARSSRWRS